MLKRVELFESCVVVGRLQGAVHLRNHDWPAVQRRYAELAEECASVIRAEETRSRIFPHFYRVNLLGDAFVLAGCSGRWIYKEGREVRIAELVDRLQKQYAGAFGADRVHVLPNTAEVNAAELLQGHAYLQVAAVSPFLDPSELAARTTDFERQGSNLRRFFLDTPFTKSGKTHGNWDEQYLRRTVITLARPFPYATKRIAVVSEDTVDMEPIENAIWVISERVVQLRYETEALHPSTKSVQQFLQGSVLLQVNPGPLAICEVFLATASVGSYAPDLVTRLQKELSGFLFECRALLLLNGSIIDASQLGYQSALITGFNEMLAKLRPYLGSEPVPDAVRDVELPQASSELSGSGTLGPSSKPSTPGPAASGQGTLGKVQIPSLSLKVKGNK